MIKVGVDVGSTHTDAVALAEGELLASVKVRTTPDPTAGIQEAIGKLSSRIENRDEVGALMLGTTHGLNAILQAKGLARTAILRIGLPAGEGIPPLTEWPARLTDHVISAKMVRGGHEYTGEEIVPLDEGAIVKFADDIVGKVDGVAITSIFSTVNPAHELRAAQILNERGVRAHLTLSHMVGGLGLIERENSTILNELVSPVFKRLVSRLKELMRSLGMNHAKLFIAQNDGTLASGEFTMEYPIFTVAGPVSNSIRGAHLLTGIDNAVVMDVGGTTTNVGVLHNGYPRESSAPVEIGGIRTNFRMPDIHALALGGGTIINESIGPESVGYELTSKGVGWGGTVLTASDVAMGVKGIKIGDADISKILLRYPSSYLRGIYDRMISMWEEALDLMKISREDVQVIAVGGGSIMLPPELRGASKIVRPDNAQFANAIGATLTKVGATVEKTFSYSATSRELAINSTVNEAKEMAVKAGGDPSTLDIREIEEVPIPYLPGDSVKLTVKVVGNLRI